MSVSFVLTVEGEAADYRLEVGWSLDEKDASCWRRPFTVTISPKDGSGEAEGSRETVFFMSREHGRLFRDALDMLLKSPDLRQGEDGEWITPDV